MDQANQSMNVNLSVDVDNLYSEETFTDMRYASIRKLTPVKLDGSLDNSRKVVFIASTQVMSQYGTIPVHAPVEAADLKDACEKFPDAVNKAVAQMMEEAQKMQQQRQSQDQSRIVVPGR